MKTKEYKTVDKSEWGDGPWQNEPDKMQFMDEATRMPCLIVRNHVGALCGYVGVPEWHPAYDKDYDSVDVRVHGGLTFAGFCQKGCDESKGVCHVVEGGGNDKVYWLGFDCAHYMDYSPAYKAILKGIGIDPFDRREIYKDVPYVKAEIAQLAQQLAAMK